jgi:signal transduction histidine kinase
MTTSVDAVSRPVPDRAGLWGAARGLGGAYVAGLVVLAGLYYGAAKLGYELEFAGPVAAIVWLPAGVAIAVLYLGGLRFWPAVLVGDLLANDYSALPLGSALGQTLGNMLEVLTAAVLIRRLVPRGSPLDSLDGLGRLLAAIAAGTAVSATIGSLSLRAGHVITSSALPEVWRTWWLGDASGALILVPLALAWHPPRSRGWARGRRLEAVLMLAAVAGISQLVFRAERPWTFLVFPALGWAAVRFGRQGATLALTLAAGFAVWNTTHYHGPFVFDSITSSVISAQLYIAVAALSALSLTAVLTERRTFAEGLDASRARLVNASDTERRRLEHNLHDGAQQRLTALAIQLGRAAERAHQANEPDAAFLDEAGKELGLAIDELRELAHGLHPTVLTDLGLGPAIRAVTARSTVPITAVEMPTRRFDELCEATAYYLLAETLTNAQKHARAASIQVRVTTTPGTLHLEVVDDGVGGADETAGSGLKGLRDRVEALGGTLDIESTGGHGTRIAAAVPATPRGP